MEDELLTICGDHFLTLKKLKLVINKDFYVRDNYGSTPLHHLCANVSLTTEMLRLVLNKDFNVKNNYETTPLHSICTNKSLNADMLQLVINKDFDMKNYLGVTPLHWLCMNESLTVELLRLIIDKNFDIKDDDGNTPLHIICINRSLNVEMLQLLIDKDFNLDNLKNKYGDTPLYYLCDQKRSEFNEIIKFIIFPFKLKKYNYSTTLYHFSEWAEFRNKQKNINDRNFKYLENSVKKSTIALLFAMVRYQIKVPKYIKWMIITFMF